MKTNQKGLRATVKKYGAVAKISFLNRLAYPVDTVMEIVFLTFIFAILFFLQRAAASCTPSSPIETLSLAQTMWTAFLSNIVAGERGKTIMHLLNNEILSGQTAYQLNRPYSFMLFHLAQFVGGRLPSLIFCAVATAPLLYWLVGLPPLTLGTFLLGAVMLCVGVLLSFFLQFCVGLSTFWVGNSAPLRWIYYQIVVVSSGMTVPLAFFPATLRTTLQLLPFSNISYGAARVIVGCSQTDLFWYVGLQLFWVVMIAFTSRAIFKAGVRNVVISGG